MSTRIYEAIVTAWNASALPSTFIGGLWFGEAKRATNYPYVVMTSLGNATKGWTSHTEIRNEPVQFSIYVREDGANDPVLTVGSLLRSLESFIKNNSFSISSSDGHTLSARRTSDDIRKDPHTDKVWIGQLDVMFLRDKPA